MAKSTILDIFHGRVGHIESMPMQKSDSPTWAVADETFNELKKKLSPDQFALLEKFVEAQENNWAEETSFYFIKGVKMGVRLGIECSED